MVQRLPGMRDAAGSEYGAIQAAAAAFETFAAARGYGMLDTPLLEQTELFVRKSGGELTTQLYSFVDPGGNRVSLRPEFTSSVIRHYAEQPHPLAQPVRWQYRGPVFRHDGAFRQFTQAGAELIGSSGVELRPRDRESRLQRAHGDGNRVSHSEDRPPGSHQRPA